MNTTIIYILIDPSTNEIRYIGKTNNLKQRLKNHLNACRDKNTHKRNWINKLKTKGFKPEIEIIDEVSINEWKYWEIFWISYYKSIGCNLLNYTIGGDGLSSGNQTSFKKGDKPWNTGIACTHDRKSKIKKTLTGVPTGRYRAVAQYDKNNNLITTYISMSNVILLNPGFQMSKISDCCNNKRNHHKNYIWKYL